MFTAKAEVMTIISLWHYFCYLGPSLSVYLTGNYNNYPWKEFIFIMLMARASEHRLHSSARCALCSAHKE